VCVNCRGHCGTGAQGRWQTALVTDDTELDELRRSLLRGGRPRLTAEQGDEAFDQHILLAARIHRAARLNQAASDGEGLKAWRRYFTDHFSPFRDREADVLWRDWRCQLIKDGTPGPDIALTHGSPRVHWTRDTSGRLLIDLESMWDEFEASVESFVESLTRDARKRGIVLKRFREREWTVQSFEPHHFAGLSSDLADGALVSLSATAMSASSQPPKPR
jgi:hypothetical protein